MPSMIPELVCILKAPLDIEAPPTDKETEPPVVEVLEPPCTINRPALAPDPPPTFTLREPAVPPALFMAFSTMFPLLPS